jgi:nucleoside-diphosphate-sugar epimerase
MMAGTCCAPARNHSVWSMISACAQRLVERPTCRRRLKVECSRLHALGRILLMNRKDSTPRLTVGVVGASGFLATHLIPALAAAGHVPRVFGRSRGDGPLCRVHPLPVQIKDLAGLDTVIHLAGIAHQKASAEDYATVNVDFAVNVATLCRDAGVGRFLFISTSQVHGRSSETAIGPRHPYNPPSDYAASKLQAETRICGVLNGTPTDYGVIRPTLVYAADAKANFRKLKTAARLGLPLPLGSAVAKRSMVSIENLNDAIIAMLSTVHGNAVLIPADPEDLSVSDIYLEMCRAAGHAWVPQPPAPPWAMRRIMSASGHADMFDSLFLKAIVDRRHWADLGWTPRQTVLDGLRAAMRD